MSRIEKAIEQAARLRDSASPTSVVMRTAEGVRPQEVASLPQRDNLLGAAPLPVKNPFLVTLTDSDRRVSEEYKKLKSVLVRLTQGKEFLNCIVITSALPSEGKSLTALNLAIALSQEYDHTVLLVDADLRKPSVHTYLEIEPKVGLVDCLTRNVPIDEALINTGIGKLVVLPAGGVVPDPVELLASNRMKEVLRELKSRYPDRYVLIDMPPVLPFADAQIVSTFADGVLFVVREGMSNIRQVKQSLASLADCNMLGVIYNDSSVRPHDGDYYYSY